MEVGNNVDPRKIAISVWAIYDESAVDFHAGIGG
jgi:hypothetical protein